MIKRNFITIISLVLAICFTIYIALDTFVLTKTYAVVGESAVSSGSSVSEGTAASSGSSAGEGTIGSSGNSATTATTAGSQTAEAPSSGNGNSAVSATETVTTAGSYSSSTGTYTPTSYTDENISITITTYRENDTDIYVADIQLASAEYLKSAFANSAYGKNVTATTTDIAESVNAILAINGDYYGVQEKGYVIRNGVLYRESGKSNQEDLVIYADGSMEIINESDISARELLENGAVNVWSFGPGLISNGTITVDPSDEVSKAKSSNPRTAIGMIDELHYVFVVADGRTDTSSGLSLYELAEFMEGLGATCAYNLDGGGSSTMVFNGELINTPVSGAGQSSERKVSDIVYIGY